MSDATEVKPGFWARIEQSFGMLDVSATEFMWREIEHLQARTREMEIQLRALTETPSGTCESGEADTEETK